MENGIDEDSSSMAIQQDDDDDDVDVDVSDLPPELHMDRYDDDDYMNDDDGEDGDEDQQDELYEVLGLGSGGLAMDADSEEDADAEDDEILPSDRLIVVACTEDEQR